MTEKDFLKNLKEQGGEQTVSHSINVARLMHQFAQVLGEDANLWFIGGLLHDAGKIFVPSDILNGTGKLNNFQFETVKKHSYMGSGIIKNISSLSKEEKKAASYCADFHHAWYSGKYDTPTEKGGYFNGMKYTKEYSFKGEAIPLIARACAICDVFEALTAARSYDPARSVENALSILFFNEKQGQFDRRLLIVFCTKVLSLGVAEIKKYATLS